MPLKNFIKSRDPPSGRYKVAVIYHNACIISKLVSKFGKFVNPVLKIRDLRRKVNFEDPDSSHGLHYNQKLNFVMDFECCCEHPMKLQLKKNPPADWLFTTTTIDFHPKIQPLLINYLRNFMTFWELLSSIYVALKQNINPKIMTTP